MIKCPQCGADNNDNSAFCVTCGQQFQQQAPPPPSAEQYNTAPPPPPGYAPPPPNYNAPPPYGSPYGPQPGYPEQKSRLVAGLLQLLISTFAVGRFYLGYTNIAIAQLLVSIFTCGLGSIWPIIDGIMILTGSVTVDGKGIPLKD